MDGTQVGSLYYDLDLDSSKFKQGAAEASKGADNLKDRMAATQEASNSFSKAFLGVATAVTAAAVGFGVESVKAYQESERINAQLAAAIKSTGDASKMTLEQFNAQATALEHLTGVSDEAVNAGSAMLSTFTNLKGPVMQGAIQANLDMATAMNSGTIPSAEQLSDSAIRLGKALNDPTTGLMALHRVGVAFTEQQKEQIKTLQANGDMMGAQKIILAELTKEFGGSAAAAGKTFTGQMNIAKESLNDLMEEIGKSIISYIVPLISHFNDWFTSVGGVTGVMAIMKTKIQELGTFLSQHRETVLLVAGALAGPLVVSLASVVAGFVGLMFTLAPVFAAGALMMLLIEKWVKAHGGLAGTIDDLKKRYEEVKQWLAEHHDLVQYVIIPAIEGLTAAWVTLKVAMFIGDTIKAAQAAFVALQGTLAATTGSFTLLGGAMSLIPLALVITVAAVGIMEILAQFQQLKEAQQGFDDSQKRGNELDNYILDQAKQAKAAGDMDKYNKLMKIYGQPNGAPPKFASGVDNFSGGFAVVGEEGPELVNLPGGSSVTPAGRTKSMLSGKGDTININAGVFVGSQAEARALAEMITRYQNRYQRQLGT